MLPVVEKTRGVMLLRFKLFAINRVPFYWLPHVVCGWWQCLWSDNRVHLGEILSHRFRNTSCVGFQKPRALMLGRASSPSIADL